MEQTQKLGTEKIGRLLLVFAVPSVVSLVLNALYNMVDQIFIGQGVGYLANGATNVIFPLTQLAVALGLLLGDGAANCINLKLGQKDAAAAEKAAAAGIAGMAAVGILLCIVYNLFLEPLCLLFGATELTLPYALEYGRIIALGVPFCVFASGGMSIVRAEGKPGAAMGGMILGCAINLVGDPLAIFALHMGVAGAAWATILGQLANAAVYIVCLARCRSIPLRRRSFRGCAATLPAVSRLGLSSFATQLSIVIVIAVQNNLLVSFGAKSEYGAEIPMTALGVTMKVFTVLQCAVTGLTAGAQPIFSFNHGSGRQDRVLKTLRYVLLLTLALTLAATALFQLAPMAVIRLFGAEDALYNAFAVKCLRIYLMFLVLDGLQMVSSAFLQSVGKPVPAAALVLFRQVVILIPAMLILTALFGVDGVLYAGPVAGLCVAVWASALLVHEWNTRRA